ncbi:MAG: hypothetical protein FWH41_10685, partial [Treponema sp.]|nr:hypothetical protein [Treponema sp.]
LSIFSGFAMNLLLHLGLGLYWAAAPEKKNLKNYLYKLTDVFSAIITVWLIAALVRYFSSPDFLEYIFLFPVCYMVYLALKNTADSLINRKNIKNVSSYHSDSADSYTGGMLAGAALFVILNIAGNFIEAVVISLGSLIGIMLAIIIIGEIQRRSDMEATPQILKGIPLALISVGLLSLIFSSAAIMLFKVLGAK